MWYVYVDWTTDSNPYPFYVGQGSERRVGRRHRNRFHSNIALAHGFRREVVFQSENREEVLAEESRLIGHLNTFHGDNPKGANFTRGGEGTLGRAVVLTEEWRSKIAASLRGRKSDPEVNKKRSETQKGRKKRRRPFTDEEREILYASRRGRDLASPEGRRRQSEKMTGRKRSPETCRKISESLRKRYQLEKQTSGLTSASD